MKTIPNTSKLGYSLVLRTDFSDDALWNSICESAARPVGKFRAFVEFLSDREFENLTEEAILKLIPANFDPFVFIVDKTTMIDPDRSIQVMDLSSEPGRTFRVLPSELWCVQNNLSIANMDFSDFIEAADEDGVYRGDMS